MSTEMITKEQFLNEIQENLSSKFADKIGAMPKTFQQQRAIQEFIHICKNLKSDDIRQIHKPSIINCALDAAFLGLSFIAGECHAVPYWNSKLGKKELTMQTDYKGEIKIAKAFGEPAPKNVFSSLVREGEKIEYGVKDGRQTLTHSPIPMSNKPIVGAYCVAQFEDFIKYEVMTREECEEVRNNYAKKTKDGKFSPAWQKSEGEMFKKTVIRRNMKTVSKNFVSIEQAGAYDRSSDSNIKTVDVKYTVSDEDEERRLKYKAPSGEKEEAPKEEAPKEEAHKEEKDGLISIKQSSDIVNIARQNGWKKDDFFSHIGENYGLNNVSEIPDEVYDEIVAHILANPKKKEEDKEEAKPADNPAGGKREGETDKEYYERLARQRSQLEEDDNPPPKAYKD